MPLSFATPGNACANNTQAPLSFYGSEVMTVAAQQWDPAFCLNRKLFNVNLVQLAEPVAKSSLQQGFIEAAVQGEPPPVPVGEKSFFTDAHGAGAARGKWVRDLLCHRQREWRAVHAAPARPSTAGQIDDGVLLRDEQREVQLAGHRRAARIRT